jgi:hypothetical protein
MIISSVTLKHPAHVDGQTIFRFQRQSGYHITISGNVVFVQHRLSTTGHLYPLEAIASGTTEPDPISETRDTIPAPPTVVVEVVPLAVPEPEREEEITRVTRRARVAKGLEPR